MAARVSKHHAHISIALLALLESLQVDDEERWGLVDFQQLGGLNMLLTLAAIPLVVLVKNFSLLELVEAVVNGQFVLRLVPILHILIIQVNPLAVHLPRKVSLELLFEVSLPDQIQDEVLLTSFGVIETGVVLHSDLVEHVKHSHLGCEG